MLRQLKGQLFVVRLSVKKLLVVPCGKYFAGSPFENQTMYLHWFYALNVSNYLVYQSLQTPLRREGCIANRISFAIYEMDTQESLITT